MRQKLKPENRAANQRQVLQVKNTAQVELEKPVTDQKNNAELGIKNGFFRGARVR